MLILRRLSRSGLHPTSLDLESGSCATIEGPSGSGKTLLLRAIADLDPSEGEVRLDGVLRETVPGPEWRRRVGYLSAEPGWWAPRAQDHFTDWQSALPLLEKMELSLDLGERPLRLLSTGERLRLALARSLLINPRVLLLDEPTGPLDSAAKASVEDLLRERLEGGTSLILVTHDPEQAARLAGQRYRMDGGRLSPETGRPSP